MTHRVTMISALVFTLLLMPAMLNAQTCDTVSNTLVTDTATFYTSSDSGYVSGHNEFGDLAKAERFVGSGNVTGVALIFAMATYVNPGASVLVRVWDDNGPNGAPGTVLAEESVTIQSIVNAYDTADFSSTIVVNFGTPAQVNGAYYAGITLSYSAGDTVVLYTTTDLTRTGTAWEQWSNQVWHTYSDSTGWDLDLSHYIFAVLCPAATGVEAVAADKITVSAAPNPFTTHTTISIAGINENYDFTLFDATGKELKELRSVDMPQITIARDNMPAGMYFYTISTAKNVVKGSLVVK